MLQKMSSTAEHTKNRNECKPNKSESKLSMKPLISMQQGTVIQVLKQLFLLWRMQDFLYWSSWHRWKYCTTLSFQCFSSQRDLNIVPQQHVDFVGTEEKPSPEKDCNLLYLAKAIAMQCALFRCWTERYGELGTLKCGFHTTTVSQISIPISLYWLPKA